MTTGSEPLPRAPFRDRDSFLGFADENGVGHVIHAALVTAERLGLGTRFYSRSVMLTPLSNLTRMVMTFTVLGRGALGVETGYPTLSYGREEARVRVPDIGQRSFTSAPSSPPDALREFFGVPPSRSEAVLGSLGHHDCGPEEALRLLGGLETLLTSQAQP